MRVCDAVVERLIVFLPEECLPKGGNMVPGWVEGGASVRPYFVVGAVTAGLPSGRELRRWGQGIF